jgi:hypothetical protein
MKPGAARKNLLRNDDPRTKPRTLTVGKRKPNDNADALLPRSNIRLFNRKVMVVLRDTETNAKELFEYLHRRKIEVTSVVMLKQKYPHYRTFVVECNEMLIESLFDEAIWNPDTYVQDFKGNPNPRNVSSCFPQAG